MKLKLFISFSLLCVVATQFLFLTDVPGLHFDEAWQGYFSWRIANEKGFWPIQAMNSYTSPVLHYILALVFKFFPPSLFTMRFFLSLVNITTCLLLAALLATFQKNKTDKLFAIFAFLLLWGALPISVFNHRFFIEVTVLHGFCLALFLWGLRLSVDFGNQQLLSKTLILVSALLGTYGHILFITVPLTTLVFLVLEKPDYLKQKSVRETFAILFLALSPLALRMGIGLGRPLPILLFFLLVVTAFLFIVFSFQEKLFKTFFGLISKYKSKALMFFAAACSPFLVLFFIFFWNGSWPYAQATGELHWYWIPVNLTFCLLIFWQSKKQPFYKAFLISFLFTSCLILKPTSRYYTVPLTFLMLGVAQGLVTYKHHIFKRPMLLGIFLIWNVFLFCTAYLIPFQKNGAFNGEFGFRFFHDSSRDFRPYQKALTWAVKNNCQDTLYWVEDDRFLFPFRFLKLTMPPAEKNTTCAWKSINLFFSHIPDYTPGMLLSTQTKPPFENVKFLAHSPEWGDLAFWIRK